MRKFILIVLTGMFTLACNQNEKTETPTAEAPQEDPTWPGAPRSPVDSITEVIEEEGPTAQRYTARARMYLAGNNMQAARNDVNQAMELDSNLAELREVKGKLHYLLDQPRYAKTEWERCLKLDPENSECIMALADLMLALTEYDRAMELVNKQIELDNNDARAYFVKGIIIRDKHRDTALALQYFQNAIDLRQDYVEAIDLMAVTLALRKDSLAKFYYHRLLELEPNNAETYFKLGVFHQERDELNRAIEAYTNAIQINPKDVNSYYNLGYIHVELDLYQQAREYFTKVIQYKDRPYNAYYARGYTYEVVGDVINARKDYRKAIEILPMYKPAQNALARVNSDINN